MPIESKVTASTIAAALTALVMWLLNTYVFHDSVPPAVGAVAELVVIPLATFAAGWYAKHTPRPDLSTTE